MPPNNERQSDVSLETLPSNILRTSEHVTRTAEDVSSEETAVCKSLMCKLDKTDGLLQTSTNVENTSDCISSSDCKESAVEFKQEIIWSNVIFITAFHLVALYTAIFKLYQLKVVSIIFGYVIGTLSGFGVTAGAHRLWAHRSYKATLPLKIILLLCYSMAGQNTLHEWVRDHRVHHRFSETDADPHNSKRGFFFAHVGWLMQRKHPEVLRRGRDVDMTDIREDPLISFHTRYFSLIKLIMCFILPTLIPIYVWGEDVTLTILGMVFVRYVTGLNFTWLVNSAAHIYGNRPYDVRIRPVQNKAVAIVAMGEGWHNYHHVFPWDYKAAELGDYRYNVTTFLLDCFAKLGYDLKSPSPELVYTVMSKHGDGTHPAAPIHEHPHEE